MHYFNSTMASIKYLYDLVSISCLLLILLLCIPTPCCRASDDGCLEEGYRIIDGDNNPANSTLKSLISPNGTFELGFFTADGENPKSSRYLGIWYYNQSNPKIVVWVANRDKPLLEANGSLVLNDGSAVVQDTNGLVYWSTSIGQSAGKGHTTRPSVRPNNHTSIFKPISKSNNTNVKKNLVRLCLEDSGDLVLHQREQRDQRLWRSFDNPTDTLLPEMNSFDGSVNLTSWRAPNNPAKGPFVFTFQILDGGYKLTIKKAGSPHFWENSITPFDKTPPPLLSLLLNNVTQFKGYNNTRLRLKFTGQIQFWRRESERGDWSLLLSEPNNKCDLFERCGTLGSCNSNNGLLCKCLPGSRANIPEHWNSGDFSQGCFPKSEPCQRNYSEDKFLMMPLMKVKAPKTNETDMDCETTCLNDCTCLAYSCGVTSCTTTEKSSESRCMIWSSSELTDLQEEYPGGYTIFFRTRNSDIESTSTSVDCKPCGTYIIPYPLSTAANCGDSSYSNFKCNATNGQVYFSTSNNRTYKVTSFDPGAKKFTIQVGQGNSCGSRYINLLPVLPNKDSSRYVLGDCKVVKSQSFSEDEQFIIEIDITWKPPPEPSCRVSSDCHNWPHTSCETASGGKKRCKCRRLRYHWNGDSLKCTEVTFFKVLIPCIASALATILLCGIFFAYRTWRKRHEELHLTGSVELNKNDTEVIDLPFFDWETIVAATINFADMNRLGTGGFGSVYRGKLPEGQDIAVKRLSSVSSVQGLEEFRTEVELIAKLQHRNLVRLTGYCVKADERILVYEFMPNGSLDSCLFEDERHSVHLDWKMRFDIILGIARGLLYLHQDSRLRIIHRDLKPSNILLDEELNPKISDFGIARIVGAKDTHASTARVVGTYGYMSPEYAYEGIFSVKSDVFSFGVVILETISGRRNSKIFMYEHGLSLLGYAWKLWNEGKGLELMDPKLNESCFPAEVQKCIHIGLLCVQEDPSDRPIMSTVVYMLSGENATLPLAKQPAFMNRKPLSDNNASSSSAKDSSVHDEMMTVSTVGR